MELDIGSPELLEPWLRDRPVDWAQAIAVRAALRVYPAVLGVQGLPDRLAGRREKRDLILQSFRAAFILWAACKYPTHEMKAAARSAAIAAGGVRRSAATGHAAGAAIQSLRAAAAAIDVADRDPAARAAVSAAVSAATAASNIATVEDIAPRPIASRMWFILNSDCIWLHKTELGLIDRPLWTAHTRDEARNRGNVPSWMIRVFDAFVGSELASNTSFGLIADWYRAILPDGRDRQPSSPFGQKADIAIATQPEEFWEVTKDRSPEQIMDDVAAIAGWDGRPNVIELDIPFPQYATEFILEYLSDINRPASIQEISDTLSSNNIRIKRNSINWILSDFTRRDQIIRVDRGLYASKKWERKKEFESDWDFFLSYSKDDVLAARRISDVLEAVGHTVFSQFNDITAGKSFVREMNRGLGGMGRLIAVYSPSYFSSGPCQAEWEAAYTYDASGESGKIVPFLVRPCEPTPLARRLVWTPLIGLDPDAERKAILDAVRDPTAPRDRASQRAALKQAVSPDVTADNSGRLDAAPNVVFDDPFVDVDLIHLPEYLRSLISTAVSALEGRNCPSGLIHALKSYSAELEARGVNCSFGVLRGQMDFIEAEIDDPAAEYWLTGAGLRKTLENMRKAHAKLGTHYPLDQLRERLFRAIEVDTAKADGADFREIEKEIAKAIDSALEDDIVTDTYRSVSANRQRVSRDILELKTPSMPTEGDEAYIEREADRVRRIQDAKKRAMAQQVGFADKSLDVLSKLTTVADSQSGRRLANALAKLVDWFW